MQLLEKMQRCVRVLCTVCIVYVVRLVPEPHHRKLLLQNRLQTPRWSGSKFTYKKLEASESETLRISALVSSSLRYSYHYRGLTIQGRVIV